MKQLYKCDGCGTLYPKKQLKTDIELDSDFLELGAILPTGRCPNEDCDGHCYPLVLDMASRKVVTAMCDVWDALSDILYQDGDGEYAFELPDPLRKRAVKATNKLYSALSPALLEAITVKPKGGDPR